MSGNSGSLIGASYDFAGWNTGGGRTAYAAESSFAISADTRLYARWGLKTGTVIAAGHEMNGSEYFACYWTDTTKIELHTSRSNAIGIFVVE
ncbi:hypothetical protein AGMMS50229_18700 [Campylobacterota bacterium]|nr:hypothetical protein AGMMS50229_18700 [Campylobacterota bacterium]